MQEITTNFFGNQPLVSVAIVTYNQKTFLIEAIESVLEQDYPHIEIVVADDGSTDGTHELLDNYAQRFPQKFVLCLSEKNKGITYNHNLAQHACSGKYIAWLGGDDLMLPGKISTQVAFMEKHNNCDICYHDLDVFDSDTGKKMYLYSSKTKPLEGDIRTLIKHGTFNGACSNMVRREKTPIKGFEPTITLASDWLYWVETLAAGGSIRYIPQVFGKYRQHQNNITKTRLKKCTKDHLDSCNILLIQYPQYTTIILYRYHALIKSIRKWKGFSYGSLFYLGIQTHCLKCLLAWGLYVLSFGRRKY